MRKVGVYLLSNDKEVVYVGKTENWPSRVAQHPTIEFTSARLFECSMDNLDAYERRFIAFFKPRHNVFGHGKRVYKRMTDQWILKNHEYIKASMESKQTTRLVAMARSELKYSPRYGSGDLLRTIKTNYESVFNVEWNHKKYKFMEKPLKK